MTLKTVLRFNDSSEINEQKMPSLPPRGAEEEKTHRLLMSVLRLITVLRLLTVLTVLALSSETGSRAA